ncbi:MAG: RNA-binding S4 domain-containing protein [Bacteroidaceae bacterium]|nr:RNA-binding S4 domain-containing protein [Bacteroidaceae bacterium]
MSKNQSANVSAPSLTGRTGGESGESGPSIARLDKWLWAARIFKTRTMAAAACKKGQVSVGGAQMKPSRTVKVGDIVDVRKPPITYSFRIKQAIEKRVGARLIPDVLENVTSPEQYELLEMNRISGFVDRARGTGRPTKKERRALDNFGAQSADIPIFISDFEFDLGDEDEEEVDAADTQEA